MGAGDAREDSDIILMCDSSTLIAKVISATRVMVTLCGYLCTGVGESKLRIFLFMDGSLCQVS